MDSYTNSEIFENDTRFYGYDLILDGIVERIKKYLEEKEIAYKGTEIKQIYNFLAPIVDGKVWVECDCELPTSDEYYYTSISIGKYSLKLAYSVYPVQRKFPYNLYVKIVEEHERNFREFWEKNYLPTVLLEDAINALDLSQHIEIHVYEFVGPWLNLYSESKNPIVFGQDFKQKKDKINKDWPIAFVDGNILALTSPNERMDFELRFDFN